MAAAAIVVVVILLILGIHSCQVSARNSALRDYNNSVNSIISQSKSTSNTLFSQLTSNISPNNAATVETQINSDRMQADGQLSAARALSVPSQVQSAQTNLLLTLTMRRDGIANIASQIQPATATTSSQSAINNIALQMARFYASDVLYKDYTVPLIAGALNAALGPNNGATFNPAQFLPNLGWLTPSFVASKLHVAVPQSPKTPCVSGQVVGHALNSVSVAGTMLNPASANTVASSPPPTFNVNITNGGQVAEANVVVRVSVNGTNVKGQATTSTTPGQTVSVPVTLASQPPTGSQTITAEVVPVHCETNTANNSATYPVTFQ